MKCTSKLWHGPGHQSQALCEETTPGHKVHRVGEAEWLGEEASTGFFNEPPTVEQEGEG